MSQATLDLLAFGAHPDDVEIGMGATLAKYAAAGYRVGICNLTKAELSSNGTVELRQREAEHAADILGVSERIQLSFADRGLKAAGYEQLQELVSVIRRLRPRLIFSPYAVDRHPDHGACTELVKEAAFNAGIRRYRCKENLPAFRPEAHYYYFINGYEHPDFVQDTTPFIETKIQALSAYKSQFTYSGETVATPLTDGYITAVEARDRLFGKEAGVPFAEGFMSERPLLLGDLLAGKEQRHEAENRD
ncbi:bacillithiol biosynthesis deacetylase BshB1 [Halalkalibacter oceani]